MEKIKSKTRRLSSTLLMVLRSTMVVSGIIQGSTDRPEPNGAFWVKTDGKILPNYVLTRLQRVRYVECLMQCSSVENCKSINFSEETADCELNAKNSRDEMVIYEDRVGWSYHETMSQPPESLGPVCRQMSPCVHGTCTAIDHGPGFSCKCDDAYVGLTCNIYASGERQATAAKSCLHIRRQYGARIPPSGFYWIGAAKPLQMYCDMEVDGGGWTKVGNMNITSNNFSYTSSYVHDDLETLKSIESPYYALSTAGLANLRQLIGFSTIRIYCRKVSVKRTIHISTASNISGLNVVDYMTRNSRTRPNSCGSFVVLADDNSILSASCSLWYNQKWSSVQSDQRELLYDQVAFISNSNHIIAGHLQGRFECDDFGKGEQIGVWMFFVR